MPFANAKLLAAVAVDFNIGADLLGKGNRKIESQLGAEKASGDTVYVPVNDAGNIYHKMDLTGEDLTAQRELVPVTVGPLTTAASVSQEDLTLSVTEPEIMTKRVAKLADEANLEVFDTLKNGAQAFVCTDKTDDVIRRTILDAQAFSLGSKLGGETFGVAHPTTYNRTVASLQANFGAGNRGNDLYRNELGDFLGFRWSKGSDMAKIDAVAQNFGNVTLTDGSSVLVISGAGPTGAASGDVSQPFTVAGVYLCDALGKSTGTLATLYAKYDGTSWSLVTPAYFTGARKYLECATITGSVTQVTAASTDVLEEGTTYLSPAVIWKQNDLLVGVKGVLPFHGADSFTIPTAFKERGILPLRGTVWSDPMASDTLFRVDVLFGSAVYQRVSITSVWIPA